MGLARRSKGGSCCSRWRSRFRSARIGHCNAASEIRPGSGDFSLRRRVVGVLYLCVDGRPGSRRLLIRVAMASVSDLPIRGPDWREALGACVSEQP